MKFPSCSEDLKFNFCELLPRRQLAFKAINERLEQLKKQQASKNATPSTKEATQKIAVADPKIKAAKD